MFIMPNPNKLKECVSEISNQVKHWDDPDYFSDEQLEEAKQIMRRDYIRNSEKPSIQPDLMTYQWCSTSLDYYTDYMSNVMKVTKEDIHRVIAQYVTGKPRSGSHHQ